MRRPILALAHVLALLLGAAAARAQSPEVVGTTGGPATVETRWIEGSPRRAEVDVVRGATRVRAYDGRTVRTASAAHGDVVGIGYYHGGPEPFAGVVLVDLARGTRTEASLPVAGAASPLRPAGLVITADASGFALVLQEQQADVNADVASTFARIGLDGRWLTGPQHAAIPWGLAALAAAPDGSYELAVLFGGWGQAQAAGQARICLVTLRADGSPSEHPWWASANAVLTDVRVAVSAAGIDLFFRTAGDELRHHRFAHDGGWGQEPPPATLVRRLGAGQSFYLRASQPGWEAVPL